jgi:hypothetical protein
LLGNGDIKFKRILSFSRIKFLMEKEKPPGVGGFYDFELSCSGFLLC